MPRKYVQNYMPDNVCFGCGTQNPDGLQIKSFIEGDECVCVWESQPKYHGWETVINGGILATMLDCHCMATALSAAYDAENREWGSEPVYRYATGTITVRYIKPTANDRPITLRAKVVSMTGRKSQVHCDVYVDEDKTAEADVVAIRVMEGRPERDDDTPFR
jgi:acyl-coenzyme A thioesterase PaaI-like protein